MQYLHTMIRISDIDASLRFFCEGLGLEETNRYESEAGRFTLIFLGAPHELERSKAEKSPLLELTYNWDEAGYDGGRNFGHVAFRVDDIYQICEHLEGMGVEINRPPRDGHMAFVKSPDGISVELLQKGDSLAPKEPWASRENIGSW